MNMGAVAAATVHLQLPAEQVDTFGHAGEPDAGPADLRVETVAVVTHIDPKSAGLQADRDIDA